MKLAANEFYAKLKQGQLSSACYWLHGDEILLVQEATSRIKEMICRQDVVYDHQIFYADLPGFDWQDFLVIVNSHSLFSERRCIELRLLEQKPTVQTLGYIQQFLDHNQDDTLIISSQKLENRLQKHKTFLALSKQCIEVSFWPLQGRYFQQWLTQRVCSLKLTLTPGALDCLQIHTEGHLLAAAQELEKLALLYKGQQIDERIINDNVAQGARFQVFQLLDAILARQYETVLRSLAGLEAQGESSVLVLWGISKDIRLLLKVKSGVSDAELRRDNVWPRRLRLLQQAARKLSVSALEALILECQKAELMLKGVKAGSVWQILTEIACVLMGLKEKEKAG